MNRKPEIGIAIMGATGTGKDIVTRIIKSALLHGVYDDRITPGLRASIREKGVRIMEGEPSGPFMEAEVIMDDMEEIAMRQIKHPANVLRVITSKPLPHIKYVNGEWELFNVNMSLIMRHSDIKHAIRNYNERIARTLSTTVTDLEFVFTSVNQCPGWELASLQAINAYAGTGTPNVAITGFHDGGTVGAVGEASVHPWEPSHAPSREELEHENEVRATAQLDRVADYIANHASDSIEGGESVADTIIRIVDARSIHKARAERMEKQLNKLTLWIQNNAPTFMVGELDTADIAINIMDRFIAARAASKDLAQTLHNSDPLYKSQGH